MGCGEMIDGTGRERKMREWNEDWGSWGWVLDWFGCGIL